MRQAGLLLLFISILYLPGGRDPVRYHLNAKLGVVVRMVIGLYWLYLVYFEGRTAFLPFGILDTTYAALNGILLSKVLGHPSRGTASPLVPARPAASR
jgi:hypothetical protein